MEKGIKDNSNSNMQKNGEMPNMELSKAYETLSMLEQWMGRNYMRDLSQVEEFRLEELRYRKITWLQLLRLPISPSNEEMYDLMSYWQNALATFNVWGNKFVFLLLKKGGETNIFFGVASLAVCPLVFDATPKKILVSPPFFSSKNTNLFPHTLKVARAFCQ